MGNSFVLKDGAGRPGGYLVQDMREICCRANGLTQRAKAVLIFADGTREEHTLEDGAEVRWPVSESSLCGGLICAQDRLLMATGEEARSAFTQMILKKSAEQVNKRAESERMEEYERQRVGETEKPSAQNQQKSIWPQRRWPPPPCWPQAVYRQGCWREPAE